jgi:hypothetical protein
MTNTRDLTAGVRAAGSCLCGAVRYEVVGALRDVILCHCQMCRRTHGHVAAYTATAKDVLRLTETRGLRWYQSSDIARRGFCGECGASIFWDPSGKNYIAIAAGTLDAPTGLKTAVQIHVDSAGDYYSVDERVPERSR